MYMHVQVTSFQFMRINVSDLVTWLQDHDAVLDLIQNCSYRPKLSIENARILRFV